MLLLVQVDDIGKKMDEIEFLKHFFRFIHPIGPFEYYVTVDPCNIFYVRRY